MKKTITIFDSGYDDILKTKPILEFLTEINTIVASVPKEIPPTDIMIEFDTDGDDDYTQPTLSIWYQREETLEEQEERERKIAENRAISRQNEINRAIAILRAHGMIVKEED